MTPSEKAIELFKKYWPHTGFNNVITKQCAIIVVDEILNNGRLISPLLFTSQEHGEKYWQEVKQIIESIK